ncbi:hypothetical protein D3C71_980720 [compost metagenome]
MDLGPGTTIGTLVELKALCTGRGRPTDAVDAVEGGCRYGQHRHRSRRQFDGNRSGVAPLTTDHATTTHTELIGTGSQTGTGERLHRTVEDRAPSTRLGTLQLIAVGATGRTPCQVNAALGDVAWGAQRRNTGCSLAVHLRHQAAGQVQIVGLLSRALIALEAQHAAIVIERVDCARLAVPGFHPASMRVVQIGLRRSHRTQAVAVVETKRLAIADRKIALHVIAETDNGRAAAGIDDVDQTIGRIEVVRTIPAADLGPAQVVQCVVLIQRIAKTRCGNRAQSIQPVVGHVTIAWRTRQAIRDGHHVATCIVVVAVVQNCGRSGGVATPVRKTTCILGHRMDNAIAIDEARQGTIGKIAGLLRIARHRCGAAECIRGVAGDTPARIRVARKRAIAIVTIGEVHRSQIQILQRLAAEQTTMVVLVAIDDERMAGLVLRTDFCGQAVRRV